MLGAVTAYTDSLVGAHCQYASNHHTEFDNRHRGAYEFRSHQYLRPEGRGSAGQ
jgi:hypothetical protein